MEHLLSVLVIIGSFALTLAVILDLVRRQLDKNRKNLRMRQALRRGIADPAGMQAPAGMRVIPWQA